MDAILPILAELSRGLEFLVSLFCSLFLLLVLKASNTSADRSIIRTVAVYMLVLAAIYVAAILYSAHPVLYVAITPVVLLLLLLSPVLLYHIVYEITGPVAGEGFSRRHYLVSAGLTVLWTLGMFFLPMQAKVQIVTNFGRPVAGYEWLSAGFTSLSLQALIFELVYISLSIARLNAYRSSLRGGTLPLRGCPAQDAAIAPRAYRLSWATAVVAIMVVRTLYILLMLISGNRSMYFMLFNVLSGTVLHIAMMFILTLNVLRRNYPAANDGKSSLARWRNILQPGWRTNGGLPLLPDKGTDGEGTRSLAGENSVPLSSLKTYFQQTKPYLNPGLSLVKLAVVFGVNRATLSGFVNKTYGVNFNVFVNNWRLQEVERLRKLKKYKEMPLMEITRLAGFGSYDSYRRAVAGNNAGVAPTKNDENQKSRGGTLPPMRMKKNEKKNEE